MCADDKMMYNVSDEFCTNFTMLNYLKQKPFKLEWVRQNGDSTTKLSHIVPHCPTIQDPAAPLWPPDNHRLDAEYVRLHIIGTVKCELNWHLLYQCINTQR